jgi:uncharacterized membrane protein YtjA (UPF0391 family)
MKWVSVIFLLLAILAGVLWMTSAVAAGIAKIVLALFLVLFVFSFFLRGRSSTKL